MEEGTQEEVQQPKEGTEVRNEQSPAPLREEPQEQEVTQVETEVETQEEPKEEVQSEPTVNDELISQYPALKMYRGKSLMEIPKAYDSIVREYGKTKAELAKLKQQQATLPEPPDQVEDPTGFEDWKAKYEEAVRQKVLSELGNQKDPIQEVNTQLSQALPGVDVQELLQDWTNENSYKLYDEFGQLRPEMGAYYSKYPQVFVNELVNYNKIRTLTKDTGKAAKLKAQEIAEKAFDEAKRSESNNPKLNYNQIPRKEVLNETEEMLARIYQSAIKESEDYFPK